MSEARDDARPIVFLMGPTGAGKTAAALWLAARLPLEILSVDSALVYRGLDIGTAKPDPAERRRVPHHLIDVCDPADAYSAGRFRAEARAAIAAIRGRGRLPLLVGGTGLYFRVLESGIAEIPAPPPALRAALRAEAALRGPAALHARLAAVDPEGAARIHPHDPQRITRALEVFAATGRALSAHFGAAGGGLEEPIVKYVLAPGDRAGLRARLARRFAAMLEQGLINEVAALRARGDLDPGCSALRAVGYREVWRHLAGELTQAEMVSRAVNATRQYAKRQYTWFRRERGAQWFDTDMPRVLDELIIDLKSRANLVDY
ncbi:MAG TPA: tRNA (adenosine(37)-N6)-dimethylallyltransferase MiaA [Gammaproteobacteria bacterium]|nr:tRNA (adenosine(37)-N6)-dimethylallyltransferase MiaA [Gammaproteobacteria bacterium]